MGRSYYVFSSGRIRRKENTLFLENDEGKKAIPIEDVDNLYFFGELGKETDTHPLGMTSADGRSYHDCAGPFP